MDELRVLVIAADYLSRAGLATLLEDQTACRVVGQIGGDEAHLANLEIYGADVILWDLGWQPEDTLEALGDVSEIGLPLVALIPDESHAAEVWAAGIRGILLRTINAERLQTALAAAARRLVTLDPALAETLFPAALPDLPQSVEALTPREAEVLQLLAEGLPNKAIARRLDISDHTVKFHVNAIMTKLGAQSRTEAVVRATRLGLILL